VGSYAIRGGTVCRRHGGSAPQVRAAANRRLAAMALPAVGRLGHFAFDEITRHRLSRGGDRAANNALHRIALVRMSAHPQTRGYVQRQLANGRTNKEILRLLKRAIAREIFRLLTRRTRSTNTAAPYTAGGSWARCHRPPGARPRFSCTTRAGRCRRAVGGPALQRCWRSFLPDRSSLLSVRRLPSTHQRLREWPRRVDRVLAGQPCRAHR
jgi:hypothetical protein